MESKNKGHWPKGKSRIPDGIYAGEFITSLHTQENLSYYKIGKLLGISARQVVRIAKNQQRVSQDSVEALINKLFPGVWSKSPSIFSRYGEDGEIGPKTWTAGVGEATLRAATIGHW